MKARTQIIPPELAGHLAKRDALFRNPTREAATEAR